MPKKFDEIGIMEFIDGPLVGSKNKYPTKISFIEGMIEEGFDDCVSDSLEEILCNIDDLKVRGCVCTALEFDGFHYEVADRFNSKQRGVFDCWQYGSKHTRYY